MPKDPQQSMSSEELIRRAREDLDSDTGDDFQLPSYAAVRREAEAARAQREAEEVQAEEVQAEADARIAEAERLAAQKASDAQQSASADTSTTADSVDEVAAGYGTMETSESDEDIYGPVVTPSGESAPEPAASRGFRVGWLRWVIAAGFVAFLLFQFLDPSTSVDNLSVGDCFDDPGGNEIGSVDLITCTEPHEYEIYALVQLTGNAGVFPGDDSLFDELADVCFNRFASYVGQDYAASVYDFSGLTPLEESWENGDHEGICLVHRFDESGVIKKSSSAANAGI
jgi:hypothetical protein